MNKKIFAISIFAATAATVAFFPAAKQAIANPTNTPPIIDPAVLMPVANEHPKIEVVFVLDTTGSMGDLIHAAKEKIWSIASTMASAQNAPDIKMGLVAYRDRGDAYVTQTVELSNDLDSMYSKLMDFKADGGGDGPESVNQALYDAVHKMSWNQDQQTYKVIFLVGDAPPHMDYQDDVKYPETMAIAKQKGIIINAIQCGQNQNATANWQEIASLGQGNYFQVEQSGNAVAIATPFDKKLAELSAKLDDTRIYYGDKEAKLKQANKLVVTDKLHREASNESKARRAAFNSSTSGKANFLGEGELVEAITSGRVDLSNIEKNELPEPMQAMSPKAQEEYVEKAARERDDLRKNIQSIAEERDAFLKKKVEETGADKDSLDAQIFSSIRSQSKEKGLLYDESSAKY